MSFLNDIFSGDTLKRVGLSSLIGLPAALLDPSKVGKEANRFIHSDLAGYALPVAAAVLAPELGISSALGAGLTSGGLETLRTHNIQRGIMSGLMAGGISGMLSGLPSPSGASEAVAEPAMQGINPETGELYHDVLSEQAARAAEPQASTFSKIGNASGSDWMNAAFPKGGGIASPGVLTGVGTLGMSAINANEAAMEEWQKRQADMEEARRQRLSAPGVPATPRADYNYMDPYTYLTQGRGGVPFTYAAGGAVYADGGGVDDQDPPSEDDMREYRENRAKLARLRRDTDELKLEHGVGGLPVAKDTQADYDRRYNRNRFIKDVVTGAALRSRFAEGGIIGNEDVPGPLGQIDKIVTQIKRSRPGEIWDRLDTEINTDTDGEGTVRYADPQGKYIEPRRFLNHLQRREEERIQAGRIRMAAGGLAALPGAQRDIKHRRSGAAALRAMYQDANSAAADARNPGSPAEKMGIRGVGDPLLHAAFASNHNGAFVQGAGDGRSDSVPAVIDGKAPAALSTGEFVVPAHAVSAIGRGDSKAGAKKLQMMVNRVHKPKPPRLPA